MRHTSIATLDRPEFINIQPFNPLLSKGEVKIFYLGQNRNGSIIDRVAANKIANTIPGSPIVGAFNEDTQDFGDHGEKIIIEDGRISFTSKTFPYGFVPTNAKVWYQKFSETDSNGETVIREYLMTECIIWTGQFPESQCIINEGKGQSMEFDKNTLEGEWTKIDNSNKEFFIINDAIISKLCILGDDVEPCFEGSSIESPKVSSQFSIEDFKNTLYSMYKLLEQETGGYKEMEETLVSAVDEIVEDAPIADTEAAEVVETVETPALEPEIVEDSTSEFVEKIEDKKDESEDDKNEKEVESKEDSSDKKDEEEYACKSEDEDEEYKCGSDDEEDKKKYSLEEYESLENKYNTLKTEFDALSEEIQSLREFKLKSDNEAKDNLIKSEFFMLSEDDIKDVIAKKAEYSLQELEEKLSVIAVRKKVNFSLTNENETEDSAEDVITYSIANDAIESAAPSWVKAVRNTAKNNNR